MSDGLGQAVPDGTYTIRMELADKNSTSPGENNQATFSFVKNGQAGVQNVSGGGFESVTIDYMVSELCDNGVIDPGETCDPVDTCPTECAPSQDACVAVSVIGAAATCNAECVEDRINSCTDGDGCCPAGCIAADDDDCTGSEIAGDLSSSGCQLGGTTDATDAFWLIALAYAFVRRRRR